MAEHIPGPWHYIQADTFKWVIFSTDWLAGHASAHSEPDARLIAAAPELLEALKKCVAHIREMTHDFDDPEDEAPELVAVDALIAKVEGREP